MKNNIVVDPNQITTLLLNGAYIPNGYMTARAAFHQTYGGKVKAIDSNFRPHDSYEGYGRDPSWYWPNSPFMRSAHSSWVIPTIVIATRYFGVKQKKNSSKRYSLRHIYKLYKGICQYTYQHIPYSEASIDHIYPTSKGGLDDESNIILCSKKFNSKKSDQYPVHDVNGKPVKPKIFSDIHHILAASPTDIRPEWETFLFNANKHYES